MSCSPVIFRECFELWRAVRWLSVFLSSSIYFYISISISFSLSGVFIDVRLTRCSRILYLRTYIPPAIVPRDTYTTYIYRCTQCFDALRTSTIINYISKLNNFKEILRNMKKKKIWMMFNILFNV